MKTRREIARVTRMRLVRDALLFPVFLLGLLLRACWRWA